MCGIVAVSFAVVLDAIAIFEPGHKFSQRSQTQDVHEAQSAERCLIHESWG